MTVTTVEQQVARDFRLALLAARTAGRYRLALEAIRDTPDMTLAVARHIAAHALGEPDARRSTGLR